MAFLNFFKCLRCLFHLISGFHKNVIFLLFQTFKVLFLLVLPYITFFGIKYALLYIGTVLHSNKIEI